MYRGETPSCVQSDLNLLHILPPYFLSHAEKFNGGKIEAGTCCKSENDDDDDEKATAQQIAGRSNAQIANSSLEAGPSRPSSSFSNQEQIQAEEQKLILLRRETASRQKALGKS